MTWTQFRSIFLPLNERFLGRLQFQNQSSPPSSSWNSKPLEEAKYATKRGGKSFIVFDFFLFGPYSNNTFFVIFREIIYDKPCPVALLSSIFGRSYTLSHYLESGKCLRCNAAGLRFRLLSPNPPPPATNFSPGGWPILKRDFQCNRVHFIGNRRCRSGPVSGVDRQSPAQIKGRRC